MEFERGKYYELKGSSIIEYICDDEIYHYATVCYVVDSIHLKTGDKKWRKPTIKVTKFKKENVKDIKIREIGTKKDLFIEIL